LNFFGRCPNTCICRYAFGTETQTQTPVPVAMLSVQKTHAEIEGLSLRTLRPVATTE